jgi:GNAT superfamily N-acetyltransferase
MPSKATKHKSRATQTPRRAASPPPIRYREVTTRDWPVVAELFGDKGACGGCWCMWWRIERGGRLWEQTKGEPSRRRFKRLIESGRVKAVLAFEGPRPVGWCTFGPRADFPRLETVKAYQPPDARPVWSIPCFFILPGYRGRGVSTGLLKAAVAAARRAGAHVLEGYPVTTTRDGRRIAAAFAWTGGLGAFEKAGFRTVRQSPPTRPLVRRAVR